MREALIVLEREGWVTNEMHRGAFINALDEPTVHDHYELFGLIYGFAAKRALARAGEDLPQQLGEIQMQFAKATTAADHYDLSIAFHSLIVKGAASPRINVALRAMSALVPGNFFEEVPEAVEVESRGLAAITRAMKQGDGEKAATEYVKMMRNVGNKVTQLFRAALSVRADGSDGLTVENSSAGPPSCHHIPFATSPLPVFTTPCRRADSRTTTRRRSR